MKLKTIDRIIKELKDGNGRDARGGLFEVETLLRRGSITPSMMRQWRSLAEVLADLQARNVLDVRAGRRARAVVARMEQLATDVLGTL